MSDLSYGLTSILLLCDTAQTILSHDLRVAVKRDKSNRKPKHQTLAEMAYYQGAYRCAEIVQKILDGDDPSEALLSLPLEPPAYSLKNAGKE